MNYNQSYDEWAEEVGIFKDSESREAWEYQQKKVDALMELIKTYREQPYPCHDHMTDEQWTTICKLCNQ